MSFYCEGISVEPSHLGIDRKLQVGLRFPNTHLENEYRSRNFTWRRHEEDAAGGAKLYSWELHVIASPINNLTRVVCSFHTKVTREALLVVVEGKCKPIAALML